MALKPQAEASSEQVKSFNSLEARLLLLLTHMFMSLQLNGNDFHSDWKGHSFGHLTVFFVQL